MDNTPLRGYTLDEDAQRVIVTDTYFAIFRQGVNSFKHRGPIRCDQTTPSSLTSTSQEPSENIVLPFGPSWYPISPDRTLIRIHLGEYSV
jgi:hypothetical protein